MPTSIERETYRLPKASPFDNHGRTVAGWTLTWGICLGVLVAGLGVIFSKVVAWVGVGLIVLALVVSFVLHVTGRGQPNRLTNTAESGAWYTN